MQAPVIGRRAGIDALHHDPTRVTVVDHNPVLPQRVVRHDLLDEHARLHQQDDFASATEHNHLDALVTNIVSQEQTGEFRFGSDAGWPLMETMRSPS